MLITTEENTSLVLTIFSSQYKQISPIHAHIACQECSKKGSENFLSEKTLYDTKNHSKLRKLQNSFLLSQGIFGGF